MTDSDDKLSRRYRELAREEPTASLDAAVLTAAKQAVQPGTRSRWMGPVAVAAVLVLGLGIALRMQVEQPGIESAAPAASTSAEYPIAPAAEEPPAPKPPVPRETTVEKRESRPQPQAFAPAPAATPAPAPAVPPATTPAAAPPPASAPMQDAAPMQSTAVPQPRAQPKLGIAAEGLAPQRAKRAESAAAADAAAPVKDAREVELERIARLRAEGHHADADKALEAFRRANPDYRIAEAMWERVRPR